MLACLSDGGEGAVWDVMYEVGPFSLVLLKWHLYPCRVHSPATSDENGMKRILKQYIFENGLILRNSPLCLVICMLLYIQSGKTTNNFKQKWIQWKFQTLLSSRNPTILSRVPNISEWRKKDKLALTFHNCDFLNEATNTRATFQAGFRDGRARRDVVIEWSSQSEKESVGSTVTKSRGGGGGYDVTQRVSRVSCENLV